MDYPKILYNALSNMGIPETQAHILKIIILAFAVILLSYIINYICKQIIIKAINTIILKTKNKWDDIFLKHGVFTRLSHIAPALIIYFSASFAFYQHPDIVSFIYGLTKIYFIIISILVINALLNSLTDVYGQFEISRTKPIKGYVQIVKIFVFSVGAILILSVILDKTPVYFLSGLGALTAVLMLVFKDSILGFVSGIQLSANDMVRIGDWITMADHNADGTVEEVTLNTVKVRNFDKTITTIPTYALVTNSFSNWRGMQESGGRRIKRSVNIDMKSIKFCTPEMINTFKRIHHLKKYIDDKQEELTQYNKQHNIDESSPVNGRRMTNIGTFRKYIEGYLRNHPKIHQDLTFLIRQLQPTEKGLPIEIYVFTNDTEWSHYEAIQADIFDHILAVIPAFELRVFQNPTGEDFQKIAH